MSNRRMTLRVASRFLQSSRNSNDFQGHLEVAIARYAGFVVDVTKKRGRTAKFHQLAFRGKNTSQVKIHIREKLKNRTMGILVADISLDGKVDIELSSTFGSVYTDSISIMNMTAGQLATYLTKFVEDNLEETYYVDPKDIRLAKRRNTKNNS